MANDINNNFNFNVNVQAPDAGETMSNFQQSSTRGMEDLLMAPLKLVGAIGGLLGGVLGSCGGGCGGI